VGLAVSAIVALPPAPAVAETAPPAVTSVTPDNGTAAGGDAVTLRGKGLSAVTGIVLAGRSSDYEVTQFVIVSDTEIDLTTPAMSGAEKTVVLRYAGPQSPVRTSAQFAAQEITVVPPVRAVDLRDVPPETARCVVLRGRFGIPATADAVLLNVTTTAPTGAGHVVVYPDAYQNGQTPAPSASTVNFIPGQDVANATMMKLIGIGQVCFTTRGARAGILIDVEGYQARETPFNLVTPNRYLDTRPASRVGTTEGPLAPWATYTAYTGYSPTGPFGGLVLANITVSEARAPGNLRVFAAGDPVPATSTANYLPGADRATLALVRTSEQYVSLYSDTPAGNGVQVMIDNLGSASAWPADPYQRGGSFQLSGRRVIDSRAGSRTGPFGGALQAGTQYRLPISALADRPAGAHTAILSVIAAAPTSTGNLRVFAGPSDAPVPNASVLNYVPGWATSNLVLADLPTDGYITFLSDQPAGQATDLVVDVVAYPG
jgi:hypothetical protein